MSKEERDRLVAELFELVTGHIKDFVFKHDAVRTIQCALKYASKAQRKIIADELKGEYRTLAESRYGKFLVAKLLVEGDQDTRSAIIAEFYGHVRGLINHPEASWILDDTYRQVALKSEKESLLREWYGPEFSIFKDKAAVEAPTADLKEILNAHPEKRKPILTYLYSLINQLVQKKMTAFTMLHDAMLQYSLAVGPPSSSTSAQEFLDLIRDDEEGDLLKNLAFTQSGARVVCQALAFGTAKDRRNMLKSYKDNITTLAYDANGNNVIIAAYEVIDDTVMSTKVIIPELLSTKLPTNAERYNAIVELATHSSGRIPILYPFCADQPKWLLNNARGATTVLDEVRTLRAETSKKEPEKRLKEIANAISVHDNGIIINCIAHRAAELAKTSFGCQFITQILLEAEGEKTAALTAVADLAEGDPNAEGHIAWSSFGGRMLKTLVSAGRWDSQQKEIVPIKPRLGFSELLYIRIKSHLLDWATGPSSLVVANYFDDKDFKGKGEIIKILRKHIPRLQEVSGEGNSGATALLLSM